MKVKERNLFADIIRIAGNIQQVAIDEIDGYVTTLQAQKDINQYARDIITKIKKESAK